MVKLNFRKKINSRTIGIFYSSLNAKRHFLFTQRNKLLATVLHASELKYVKSANLNFFDIFNSVKEHGMRLGAFNGDANRMREDLNAKNPLHANVECDLLL